MLVLRSTPDNYAPNCSLVFLSFAIEVGGRVTIEYSWQAIFGYYICCGLRIVIPSQDVSYVEVCVAPFSHYLAACVCPRRRHATDFQVVDARMYQVVACLSHPKFRTASSFSRACLSPSAAYAAAPSANGNVYVWDIARSTTGSGSSDSGAAFAASGAGTGTPSSSSLPSSVVATVLQTHGVAASGCDWCLNMPSTLASCDSKGGLRVWG